MYPKSTQYKLAETDEDFEMCHSLTDAEMESPTVMAVRDSKAIGLISTSHGRENLIATPMVANSLFTCARLYGLYNDTLKDMGISHYLFNVEKSNKKMINTVERLLGSKPYTETDDLLWYVRRL